MTKINKRPYVVAIDLSREDALTLGDFFAVYALDRRDAEMRVWRHTGGSSPEGILANPEGFHFARREFLKAKTTGKPVFLRGDTFYEDPSQEAIELCWKEGGKSGPEDTWYIQEEDLPDFEPPDEVPDGFVFGKTTQEILLDLTKNIDRGGK